jgi:thiamine kinase-like enzyme
MSKIDIIKEFRGGSMARTFLVKKNDSYRVRKIVNNSQGSLGAEKLFKQWEWIFEVERNAPQIFPSVSFFVFTKDFCYYDMEFINMPTLRDLLIQNEEMIDTNILHKFLEYGSIIAQPLSIESPKTDSYIMDKHIRKMIERCQGISALDLYKRDKIIINGKEYTNLKPLLNEIKNDSLLLEYLRPKCWYLSHGDFTFQNVLTNFIEIKIIDPRGEGPDSVYYDLAKIYQSCHGKYDLLYDGNYKAYYIEGEVPKVDYVIYKHVDKFDKIFKIIRELIPQYYKLYDKHWEMITKFYEASHFLSMTPFRLKENPQITVICYAIGIQLLNEFMEEWKNVKPRLIQQESVTI